jgi:nucleoside-diphosphate-sugar epimerase
VELLVLGGTHHVGRAVVESAVARGFVVTTLTRGLSGRSAPGTKALHGDRTDIASLQTALGSRSWDAVIDTWSGAPRHVLEAATILAGRVGHYGYVSSRSVYSWPIPVGADETAPVVDGDPMSLDSSDYATAKRGGEIAVRDIFGDRALVARPGLILGPYEQIGRLPWWLRRMERGGRVLAPGPPERPLQYIDGRDLADWMISAAEERLGGMFNTMSQPGFLTMRELLEGVREVSGSRAELVWASPQMVEQAGIEAWTELPIWLPPDGEAAGLHAGDVTAAFEHGLRCRPFAATAADTWRWLQAEGDPKALSEGSVGLATAKEEQALDSFGICETKEW